MPATFEIQVSKMSGIGNVDVERTRANVIFMITKIICGICISASEIRDFLVFFDECIARNECNSFVIGLAAS